MHSFYDVLEVSRDAELADIRKAYKQALLRLHPDKQRRSHTAVDAPSQLGAQHRTNTTVNQLQLAFDVLKDAELRAAHDASLAASAARVDVHPWDTVLLSAMDTTCVPGDAAAARQTAGRQLQSYTHDCRCGDVFLLTAQDAAAHMQPAQGQQHASAVLIGCATCGNVLEVVLD